MSPRALFRFLLAAAIVAVPPRSLLAGPELPKLKVGFIAVFSGPGRAYGIASRNGFELGLLDAGERRISVIYEDDEFQPSKTVSALRKLISVDKVQAAVCVGSSPCNAIAPIAEANRLPLLAWASDRTVALNRSFILRSYPSGEAEGNFAAAEALRRGYRRVALAASVTDYALSWRAGVVPALPKDLLVMNEEVPADTHDLKPLILRARRHKVDSFLICLLSGQSALLAKQAAKLGVAAGIGGCDFLNNEDEQKGAEGALDKAWFVTIPVSDEFRNRYRQRHGNESAISGAAVHYDLARLLHVLVEKEQTADLIRGLVAISTLTGAAGPFSVSESAGDRFLDYGLVAQKVRER